jgi:hypothetical protein
MNQAVLIAVGIDWDGRRQILAVEMANRESRSAWKDFLVALKARGLKGVELVVSDDHAGLVAAIGEVIPEAAWQRCYVHFLRNALDHLPRKHGDDCLQELRWLYDRRDLAEAKADLAAWLAKWSARYPRLTTWVEETIDATLTFFRLPRQHHKHLKSTDDIDKSDVGSFVSLFGSGEPVSSSWPTHRHRLPCRDAVKAGRRPDGSASHDTPRPCLDGVEHGARLEQTVSAIVVTAHSLCYDRPARTTTWRRVAREDESAAAQPIVAPPLWRPCAASALVIASAGPSARRHARHFRPRPSPGCAIP